MPGITTEITVFTDANTMLNTHAIRDLVKHFQDPVVGVAAGEKRVVSEEKDGIASKSEGIYWKYESFLKSMDSRLHSVIGAAGELYAIRTNLYPDVDPKVIIEDFYISMRIAMGGKVIRYAPDAYAMEKGSISISEEMKRKVRIAAGGLQVILLLYPLLNIFRYGWLSFQYISHRVLRWTLAPLGLLVIFLCSMSLGLMGNTFYLLLFLLQVVFYLLAIAGWILSKRSIKVKLLYLPFYFSMMNYAVYVAFFSLLRGKKFEVWEKAERVS
jgi:cellulose synthase/poly-beta-1,6-N-acetylglucosamine synthase-like glycosyltransferase